MNPLQQTFSLLTAEDLAILERRIVRRRYAPDQVVLREGERARKLFLIVAGTVRVEKAYLGASVPVAELGVGELFGEISFVDDAGASAAVVAHTDCEIGEVDAAGIEALFGESPGAATRFYHSLACLLGRRLRKTTQSILPGVFSG